jgi:hypothetical protein
MPSNYRPLSQDSEPSIEFDTMSTSEGTSFLHRAGNGQADQPKDRVSSRDSNSDRSSIDSVETQAGVKTIEAVSQTWTTSGLYVAYMG